VRSLFIKFIIPHSVHLSSTIHKYFVYSKITRPAGSEGHAFAGISTIRRRGTLLMFGAFKLSEHSAQSALKVVSFASPAS